MNDELAEYNEWIKNNEGDILEQYIEGVDFPDYIYEGLVDDDYIDAEETYLETITLDDVPDDFISEMYEGRLQWRREQQEGSL